MTAFSFFRINIQISVSIFERDDPGESTNTQVQFTHYTAIDG